MRPVQIDKISAQAIAEPKSTEPTSYAWYVLAVLFFVNVVNYIDRQILSILMEAIKLDLSLSDTQLGFLSGITFALFYAMFGIPLARLADRWSRRNVLALSIGFWSLFTAACGLARTFPQLLAARTAVAIGESGCTPSAHSILTDLFPKTWRVRTIAIYSLGLPVGILLGLAGGGWLSEHLSWRAAFVAVGLPGILLAVLVMATVREPKRVNEPGRESSSTWSSFRTLWKLRSYRHILIATSLNALGAYGVLQWTPSFFIRSHGMQTAELGLYLGLIVGIAGAVGTLAGGWFTDALGKRNPRWFMGVPAIAMLSATPFYFGVYFAPTPSLALAFYIIPSVLNYVYMGPVFACVQMLAPVAIRATAVALLLFVINLIGVGLGPQAVGLLSDLLRPALGVDSLRWALCLVVIAKALSGLHYFFASRHIMDDLRSSSRNPS